MCFDIKYPQTVTNLVKYVLQLKTINTGQVDGISIFQMLSIVVCLAASVFATHTPIQTKPQTQYLDAPADYSGYRFCEVISVWMDGYFSVNGNIYINNK
jgi:hypothetical protein